MVLTSKWTGLFGLMDVVLEVEALERVCVTAAAGIRDDHISSIRNS